MPYRKNVLLVLVLMALVPWASLGLEPAEDATGLMPTVIEAPTHCSILLAKPDRAAELDGWVATIGPVFEPHG